VTPGCPLTPTQLEIVKQLAAGYTLSDIARQRHCSRTTRYKHIRAINRRLGTRTSAQIVDRAYQEGLLFVGGLSREEVVLRVVRSLLEAWLQETKARVALSPAETGLVQAWELCQPWKLPASDQVAVMRERRA
jgi:DNA-binding CsgD family transcriptional regulator